MNAVSLRGRKNRVAPSHSHSVSIERRSGSSFAPIGEGGQVAPNEPIRLVARDVLNGSINEPEFIIVNSNTNAEVFRRSAGLSPSGVAFLDTTAPNQEGNYQMTIHAQSFPFLPFTHTTEMSFQVTMDAPAPPPAPPKTGLDALFGDAKTILLLGLGAVVVVGLTGLRK